MKPTSPLPPSLKSYGGTRRHGPAIAMPGLGRGKDHRGTKNRVMCPVLFLWLILTLYLIFGSPTVNASPENEKNNVAQKKTAPISITVQKAVLMALENNHSLKIERLNPLIYRTFEEEAQAAFDPIIGAGLAFSREEGRQTSTSTISSRRSADEINMSGSQRLASGTELGLDLTSGRLWTDSIDDRYTSRLGLSVTQALLQGKGLDVNLASLRQARLDTSGSQYELRGFSETLIALVEETYWDYVLAKNRIHIFENSLELAEQQLKETEEIIQVGKLAETEIVAAQAEIALRRQELIDARSVMASTRLNILRLLNAPGPNLWDRELILLDQPLVPESRPDDIEVHIKVALRMRPELKQAELEIERGELQLIKTKNGLLPKLDLFISLGKTGYADSFGGSISNITDENYDFLAGLRLEFPVRKRESKARHERAMLSNIQTKEALNNLSQLIELDVRKAYIELNRAEKQISASKASLKLEEEKVRIEKEKFRVGKSTSFLVAQAQRDLVRARIQEISSVVNYLKGLVDLFRLEGSLLERWGIKVGEVDK